MIFVSTGTVSYKFKRLVDSAIKFYKDKNVQVVIQAGYYKPEFNADNIKITDFVTFTSTLNYYRKADLIISACGEASVHLILKYSRNIPIFFPRQKKFGEHVDDQQMLIAKYLLKKKMARVAYSVEDLNRHLKDKNNYPNNNRLANKPSPALVKALDEISR